MSKSLQNAVKVERECTHLCKSKMHSAQCIAVTTKRGVTDQQLASYLFHLCSNFAKKQDKVGRSVLHIAASCGKHELCQWLVTMAGANPNIRDFESGYTPLHKAIYYGHVNTAVRLIQFGASLDINDNEDMTVLDMLCRERSSLDSLSLFMQCQPYVWGVNKNYSLGTGSDNTRKAPELLDFTKQSISIIVAEMEELHSVYVSSCGKVWTCGMGQGGRLGSGSNKSCLTPQQIRIPDKCIAAAVGVNHTLLLLENHAILSFGLNMEHQLGIVPYVESCVTPRQVSHQNFSSSNPITGICASKYHSVFYNDTSMWTCGLNGGQLGRTVSQTSHFITQPMKVPLSLNNRKITSVASSIGAIVIAVANGDIYILNKFQFKKMASKHLDILKIGVYGGALECENITESPLELRVVILNSRGNVYLWREGTQHPTRCIFGTRLCINVTDFCLTQQYLMLITKDGTAFQGTFATNSSNPAVVTSLEKSNIKSNQFHKFVEKSECYSVRLKRLQNVFRAVSIRADPRGNNFAVIQTHPKTALTDIPVISDSEIPLQMGVLFEEASEDDSVHDAIIKVSGRVFPVHCYILSIFSKLLAEEAFREKIVVLRDVNPFVFEQILLFLYTGCCKLLVVGPFDTKRIGKKEDPLKIAFEVCNKYKIQALSKKLQKLRYDAGKIWLRKDDDSLVVTEAINLDRECGADMFDVTIRSEDGSIIKAHRCILVARLDYFHSMFLGGWSETGADCVIPLPFSHRVLKDLIDFIYTDELPENLSPEDDLDHVIRLLIAGDQLLLTRLKECCELLLINALTLRNAPTVLHLASIYNTPQLKASAIQFISLNLASFLQSRLLEPLDDAILKELSDYYREFSEKKYRVLTPFPEAPYSEEIITCPSIPWPEEFSPSSKIELPAELKSPPMVSKKKKTPKKSPSLSISEDLGVNDIEICREKEASDPEPAPGKIEEVSVRKCLFVPTYPIEEQKMWNESQFPLLDSHSERPKKIHLPPSRCMESNRWLSPIVKLSQKERKRLSSESEKTETLATSPPTRPVKTWAILPPLPTNVTLNKSEIERDSLSEDTSFNDIMAHDKEKKVNLAKMKSKSFQLTQMEDKAIEELMIFYNAVNEYDERITVERIYSSNIEKPQWITSKHIV